MALSKIDNLVDIAKYTRLIEQDKGRATVSGLVGALVSEVQEVEDAAYDVYSKRGVYNAVGAQLDIEGKLVGEARNGRNDDLYRLAILARIKVNTGSGEPNTIIDAVKQFMDTDIVDFSEPYPAFFTIFIQSNAVVPNIASIVKEISPAGVNSSVSTLPKELTPFTLGSVRGAPADFIVQSTSLPAAANNYSINGVDNLEIQTRQIISTKANTGLGTVYLTKKTMAVDEVGTEYNLGDGSILEFKLINTPEDYIYSRFGGRLATVRR